MKIPDFTEFIPPSADIVSAAAERLVEILSESFNPSDLSKAVLILPTRSAARTLRLKINETFKKKGVFAVGGLRIVTPEIFIEEIVKFVPFANVFESYNAWFCAFDSLKARNLDGLFPRGNPQRTDYPSLAKRLTSLRKTLAESMLAIADVSRILRNGEDSKRWSDLALLEKTYLEKLSSSKKISAESAPMEAMKLASSSFPGVEEIILIGLPDPAPALIKILEQMQDRKIGIVTFSDKGDCAFFDSWGRPISEGKGEWSSRVLSVDASSILVAADLREQAGIVAEAVAIYGAEAGRAAAVACGESDSIKPLMNALRERGIDAYIPEGAPLSSLPQILLLGDLSNYILDDSYRNLTALLRNPCMFEYVSSRLNRSVGEILESIDGLFEDTIFDSSKSALALASGKKKYELAVEILKLVEDLVSDVLTAETSSRGLAILFNRFFPEIKFGEEFEDPEAISRMVADFLENCLKELSAAQKNGCVFSVPESIGIILESAQKRKIPPTKSARSVALLDWMEIFWASQPHVILTDMNDGIVPQKVPEDFFLPDSVKSCMELRDSKMRHCRDAWMLDVLAKSRANGGMLSVIVPRTRIKEPAQASRLLLQCSDSELAERVKYLFSLPESHDKNYPFEKSWSLKIPYAPIPEKLSVSGFKSYLACPFRFYLDYILRLKPFDPFALELGRDKLGTLVHASMEMFMSSGAANSKDESEIAKAIGAAFDFQQRRLYGGDVSAAVLFQLKAVKSSLSAAVPIQAGIRIGGYETIATEEYFDNLKIGNFRVSMRIDRIDRNKNGDLLVIDYKTKDNPEENSQMSAAERSHRRSARGLDGKKSLEWTDLQLPLYKAALELAHPGKKISCAHFIISGNPENTQLSEWEIDEDAMHSALECANDIAAKISAREFLPAQKPPHFDNYKDLFAFSQDCLGDFLEFENEK